MNDKYNVSNPLNSLIFVMKCCGFRQKIPNNFTQRLYIYCIRSTLLLSAAFIIYGQGYELVHFNSVTSMMMPLKTISALIIVFTTECDYNIFNTNMPKVDKIRFRVSLLLIWMLSTTTYLAY